MDTMTVHLVITKQITPEALKHVAWTRASQIRSDWSACQERRSSEAHPLRGGRKARPARDAHSGDGAVRTDGQQAGRGGLDHSHRQLSRARREVFEVQTATTDRHMRGLLDLSSCSGGLLIKRCVRKGGSGHVRCEESNGRVKHRSSG